MKPHEQLQAKRREILDQLAAIDSLRKGTLNEQWFPVVRGGKKTNELRGPYWVWTFKRGKRTVSERLKSTEQVRQARKDAANYVRFRELCRELETVIHELGELEREEAASKEALKKGLTSRSNRAGKSPASSKLPNARPE